MTAEASDRRRFFLESAAKPARRRPGDTIRRTGVVRTPGCLGQVVEFDLEACAGCHGWCGFGLGSALIAIPTGTTLPDGSLVEVSTSARLLRRVALAIFAFPLGAIAASVALVHFAAWPEWTVAGGTLAGLAATTAFARLRIGT